MGVILLEIQWWILKVLLKEHTNPGTNNFDRKDKIQAWYFKHEGKFALPYY